MPPVAIPGYVRPERVTFVPGVTLFLSPAAGLMAILRIDSHVL